MNVQFVDLKKQHESMSEEIQQAISNVIRNTAFILGEEVKLFEEEFAEFCGARYAIGVASGTDALELALRALSVGEGDEVITPANTFIATALAISHSGAKPVFVDVESQSHNIDISKIENAITKNTKAIIPVHLYGQPCDMDPILAIARKHDLRVIEDACQAHGALYKGKRAGTMGDIGCFSFYPAKNLGACGDGGCIVTNNETTVQSIRMLRDYGQSKKYQHDSVGFNSRLDSVQAAVLRVKLSRLKEWNEMRRKSAARYNEQLKNTSVETPKELDHAYHVYHLYVIKVKQRDGLRHYLSSKGVAAGIHYPIPIHQQGAYSHLGYETGDFPVTEELASNILSLPMFPELTEEEVKYVVDRIKEYCPDPAIV
jgi:dTDP-4-amino-4,6-dideoxygalactose transaminase